jgi:RNA polymerase sigma-70 factor (ECF subfamily)
LLEVRRKVSAPALTEEALAALCDEVPDAGYFEDRLSALRECLRGLAPRARELVWLRYHGELGSLEIATKLTWKEPAVRVALSKARTFLRECVQRQLAGGTP